MKNQKTQMLQNQIASDQLSSSQHEWSSHLRNLNNAKQEEDFTKIPLLSQENSMSNSKVYQEYLKIYYKFKCLYYIKSYKSKRNPYKLIIYNTQRKSEKKLTMSPKKHINNQTCIAELPNGDLFCYGNAKSRDIRDTVLIDRDFNFHDLPPSKEFCFDSSAIYYNKSVYCFGGCDYGSFGNDPLTFSYRFDLDLKRWIKLPPLPEPVNYCNTIIFNENILISHWGENIWLYSIDINSFSIIPYVFKYMRPRIMVNSGNQLYLIENSLKNWLIYESGIGDEYTWKRIKKFKNITDSHGCAESCLYNKEKERIYILSFKNKSRHYYMFDLNGKALRERKKCIIF